MADHANSFLLVTVLSLATIVLIFGMKYFAGARQALLRFAGEEAYRDLAEKSAAAQAASAATLAAVQAELTEVKTRLTAIQTVLQQVG
jgi:Tfp pilus assembly protein PilO